jgi:hypothetical protein
MYSVREERKKGKPNKERRMQKARNKNFRKNNVKTKRKVIFITTNPKIKNVT